ncbi:MAG: 2-oxoglutarate dehydrogenase E1 component [Phycisphaerales bacterium]|nr:2-oxoglutarate dehydrogenase E1 component [Phycisphaerales bacterium]
MSSEQILPDCANLAFVETLYADYLRDPAAVPDAWRVYFAQLPTGDRFGSPSRLGPTFRPSSIFNPPRGNGSTPSTQVAISQDRIDQLIRAYRVRGHTIAAIDPLHSPPPVRPELKPSYYGFTVQDFNRPFSSRTISGSATRTLKEILLLLRNTYCRSIGVQFMHIDNLDARHWLQERMEGTQNRITLTREEQLRILTKLTDAVIFEEFIQKKYVGAKRFSLEGGESLIPLLDVAIEQASGQGVDEIVIGMAHRGRLNVLCNIMGMHPRKLFRLFEDIDAELWLGRGDVKYHLGHHGDYVTQSGRTLHLALCFNPSHLEYVNPVVLGRVRAKQDRLQDRDHERSMALLIHGDAAFAGEGIVQETLNLSELRGYRTGGTLHVIVNNQLGFTTTPREGRSTQYATDVAKMLQSPIFHVNGENPEAVAQAIRLALDFRRTFRRDVVIDMYCYRKHGHNESDEPSFTQPLLYRKIEARSTVRDGYLKHLLELGGVTRAEADQIAERRREFLEEELRGVRTEGLTVPARPSVLGRIWSSYTGGPDMGVPEVDTGIPPKQLTTLLGALAAVPDGFHLHPKLRRFQRERQEMATGKRPLDWATGEALAFATLLAEGAPVRLSGQDSARGTFSQRHAIFYDNETGTPYTPLEQVAPDQAPFRVYNSPLSEMAVLGFDYGYSMAMPDALVLWEAQFGDFVNAAQVIIDQFIASAEDKWHSLNGLVLLLPHGLEGQGPEHSSARLERFLNMAAEDNMQVANPTTPAQFFHLLRRQVRRVWRKPLIVMTPKSLLRHKRAVSPLEEFTHGRFQRVLPDTLEEPGEVKRILLCSGKVYYDLLGEREQRAARDVAIVRVEQYYPLPQETLATVLASYAEDAPVFWVQEEPANMGAWPHFRLRFGASLCGRSFAGITRPESASPATGSTASHKLEQQRLLEQAFGNVPARV